METLTNFAALTCIFNLVSLESIQNSVITINNVHHAFRVELGRRTASLSYADVRNIWNNSLESIKLDKHAGLTNFLPLLVHTKTLLVINLDLEILR